MQIVDIQQVVTQTQRFNQPTVFGDQHRFILRDPLLLALLVVAQHHKNALPVVHAQIHTGVRQVSNLTIGNGDVTRAANGILNGIFQTFLRLGTGLQKQA